MKSEHMKLLTTALLYLEDAEYHARKTGEDAIADDIYGTVLDVKSILNMLTGERRTLPRDLC